MSDEDLAKEMYKEFQRSLPKQFEHTKWEHAGCIAQTGWIAAASYAKRLLAGEVVGFT